MNFNRNSKRIKMEGDEEFKVDEQIKEPQYIGYYSAICDERHGHSVWETTDGREVKVTQVYEGENESGWNDVITVGAVAKFVSGHGKPIIVDLPFWFTRDSNPRIQLPLISPPKPYPDNKQVEKKEMKIEKLQVEKEEIEKKQHYRITVSQRGGERLNTILDACGNNSLEGTESNTYIVITTKTIAEQLKTDNDWVEKVELFPMYHIRAVVDE